MQMSAISTQRATDGSPVVMCNMITGLHRRQRQLCQLHPDVMLAVVDGISRSVHECQNQFSSHRWNCTTIDKGRILLKGRNVLESFAFKNWNEASLSFFAFIRLSE